MFRYFNIALAVAALVALVWVLSLPTKAECTASGRVVDPTDRRCQTPVGYELLQEHAWFHSREVLLGAALLWGTAFALHRRARRKASKASA